MHLNLWAAWVGILLGMLSGAAAGLGFYKADFLGGYDAWPRRLVRLGHISFFGLAFINIAFVLTIDHIDLHTDTGIGRWASWLLVAGAATMPTVCYLAAWRQPLRHLFAVPVGCLVTAVILTLMGGAT